MTSLRFIIHFHINILKIHNKRINKFSIYLFYLFVCLSDYHLRGLKMSTTATATT